DVFKASDYKISPFELESALLEHEAVAEAAVVPATAAACAPVPPPRIPGCYVAPRRAPKRITAHRERSNHRTPSVRARNPEPGTASPLPGEPPPVRDRAHPGPSRTAPSPGAGYQGGRR
ncbi:hypothetical protein ACWCO4_36685, partial [Streptomyces virginiae]